MESPTPQTGQVKGRGYWATHELKRSKVGDQFVGWLAISKLALEQDVKPRNKLLALTCFKTGGRIKEVMNLKRSSFDFSASPRSIVVTMPVQKKWKYDDETKEHTRKVETWRTFPVIYAEQLTSEWKAQLERRFSEVKYERPLFASWESSEHLTRNSAYKILAKMGSLSGLKVFPHWFRGQRASQLADDYEFDTMSLNAFFGWTKSNRNTSERYATLSWSALERRMLLALKNRKELEAEYTPQAG